MKPEKIDEIDYEHYAYAICKCPLPLNYAIKIPKLIGVTEYKFKCDKCGAEGFVYTDGKRRS